MNDWLIIRSSFSISTSRRWRKFRIYRKSDIRKWWLIMEFELDIPSLTEHGIQMNKSFEKIKDINYSSMLARLILIEMPTLFIISFDEIIVYFREVKQYSGFFVLMLFLFVYWFHYNILAYCHKIPLKSPNSFLHNTSQLHIQLKSTNVITYVINDNWLISVIYGIMDSSW